MNIDMRLNPDPFRRIRLRQKVMEFRVNDEKRRQITVGDVIIFRNRADEAQTLMVEVTKLITAPDWIALADKLAPEDWGDDTKEAFLSRCVNDTTYTAEEVREHGVVGIGIGIKLP